MLRAETLHVLVRADGLLDGGVLTGQPTPVLHTAVQTRVRLDRVHTHIHIRIYSK